MKRLKTLLAGPHGRCVHVGHAWAQTSAVPAPGTSARIDAIKKSGVLRAAVLSNPPWLVENTTGSGDAWAGPAWLLANEYAPCWA
jgi:polar amino acid transport system substrate-binding protein